MLYVLLSLVTVQVKCFGNSKPFEPFARHHAGYIDTFRTTDGSFSLHVAYLRLFFYSQLCTRYADSLENVFPASMHNRADITGKPVFTCLLIACYNLDPAKLLWHCGGEILNA